MAEDNSTEDLNRRPTVRLIVSNPMTNRFAHQCKRLDRVLRTADERFGRGMLDHEQYSEVQVLVKSLEARISRDIGELDKVVRSNRRNQTRRARGKAKAPNAKANGAAAAPKSSSTTAATQAAASQETGTSNST
ncbi:MAG: hypothetical protein RJQ08_11610 [Salinisphaeraceae bacterium]